MIRTWYESSEEFLRKDKEIGLALVKINCVCYSFLEKDLKKDKKISMEVVKNYGLEYADISMKKDKEVVMKAVKNYGSALQYADISMKKDKEVVMEAVKRSSYAFEYADKSFKKDKQVVIEYAKRTWGDPFKFCDDSIKKEVVIEVLNDDNFKYVETSDLMDDKEVIIECFIQKIYGIDDFDGTDSIFEKKLKLIIEYSEKIKKEKEYQNSDQLVNYQKTLNNFKNTILRNYVHINNKHGSFVNKKLAIISKILKFLDFLKSNKLLYDGKFFQDSSIFHIYYYKKLNLFRKTIFPYYYGQLNEECEMNGKGRLFHQNSKKLSYYGGFLKNKKNDFGIEYNKNGDIIRKGVFENGILVKPINEDVRVKEIEKSLLARFETKILDIRFREREKHLLGKGAFADVYKFEDYAFKYFHCVQVVDSTFTLLSNINHPNVLKIHGFSKSNPVGILLELCDISVNGFLRQHEEKHSRVVIDKRKDMIDLSVKLRIIYQTSVGVEFLHLNRVLHRDLKWANVLLLLKHFYSTEVFSSNFYSYPCDVFSFGIMIHELLFETIDPYEKAKNKNNKDLWSNNIGTSIKNGLRPRIPQSRVTNDTKWLIDLCQKCWESSPSKRPTMTEIVRIVYQNYKKVSEKGEITISIEKQKIEIEKERKKYNKIYRDFEFLKNFTTCKLCKKNIISYTIDCGHCFCNVCIIKKNENRCKICGKKFKSNYIKLII